MNDEQFHDLVMIWLLRRLDLGAAKHEMFHAYGDLFVLKDMQCPKKARKRKKPKKAVKT